MRKRRTFWLITLSLALTLAACSGDDDGNNGNGGDTGMADTTLADSGEDTSSADTGGSEDSGTDSGEDSSDTSDEKIPISSFTYQVDEESCGGAGDCRDWITVTRTGQLTIAEDGMTVDNANIDQSDYESIRSDLLIQTTADKMVDGWSCDEPTSQSQDHNFQARVWDEGTQDYEQQD